MAGVVGGNGCAVVKLSPSFVRSQVLGMAQDETTSSMSSSASSRELYENFESRPVTFLVPSKVAFRIGGLVLLFLASSLAALWFQHGTLGEPALWVDFIKLVLPILGFGFALYGAVHADLRIREQREDRLRAERDRAAAEAKHAEAESRSLALERKHQYDRLVERTFEALRRLDERGGIEDRVKIKDMMVTAIAAKEVDPTDASSVRAFLEKHHPDLKPREFRHMVGRTLGRLEDLALAIKYGHVEEQLVYDSMRLVVANFHLWFGAWMNDTRFKDEDKSAYEWIMALAAAWKKKTSLRTKQPLSDAGRARLDSESSAPSTEAPVLDSGALAVTGRVPT